MGFLDGDRLTKIVFLEIGNSKVSTKVFIKVTC